MSREAAENLTGRQYKELLKRSGRLPTSKEVRELEKRSERIAREVDYKRSKG